MTLPWHNIYDQVISSSKNVTKFTFWPEGSLSKGSKYIFLINSVKNIFEVLFFTSKEHKINWLRYISLQDNFELIYEPVLKLE